MKDFNDLDYDTVVSELSSIVAANPDYTYKDEHDECVYFNRYDNSPSCLIGHWLDMHEVGLGDLNNNIARINSLLINGRTLQDIMSGNDNAIYFLQTAQDYQDMGRTWGVAFERARLGLPGPALMPRKLT